MNEWISCCQLLDRIHKWVYATAFPTTYSLYDDVKDTFKPQKTQRMDRPIEVVVHTPIADEQEKEWELMG